MSGNYSVILFTAIIISRYQRTTEMVLIFQNFRSLVSKWSSFVKIMQVQGMHWLIRVVPRPFKWGFSQPWKIIGQWNVQASLSMTKSIFPGIVDLLDRCSGNSIEVLRIKTDYCNGPFGQRLNNRFAGGFGVQHQDQAQEGSTFEWLCCSLPTVVIFASEWTRSHFG